MGKWEKNIFLSNNNKQNKNILLSFGILILSLFILVVFRYQNFLVNKNVGQYFLKYNYSMKISDESDACLDVMESFYEDELFTYYFDRMKSNEVYANINGVKYLVKDLLNYNSSPYYVTVDRLEKAGLEFIRENKYVSLNFQNVSGKNIIPSFSESGIVDVRFDPSFMEEDTVFIYFIPKQVGEVLVTFLFEDVQNEIMYEEKYSVIVDSDFRVNYEKIN